MIGNVLKDAEKIMERDHDFARHVEYRILRDSATVPTESTDGAKRQGAEGIGS